MLVSHCLMFRIEGQLAWFFHMHSLSKRHLLYGFFGVILEKRGLTGDYVFKGARSASLSHSSPLTGR